MTLRFCLTIKHHYHDIDVSIEELDESAPWVRLTISGALDNDATAGLTCDEAESLALALLAAARDKRAIDVTASSPDEPDEPDELDHEECDEP